MIVLEGHKLKIFFSQTRILHRYSPRSGADLDLQGERKPSEYDNRQALSACYLRKQLAVCSARAGKGQFLIRFLSAMSLEQNHS